jgi:hypothetical protein
MNLQARRISGSQFSAEDKLEITFDSNGQEIFSVVHSIEMVSGGRVLHGGGAQAGTYLHYKSIDIDSDNNGRIDYSTSEMVVEQEEPGTSIIRVICNVVTKEAYDKVIIDFTDYQQRAEAAGVTNENPQGTNGEFLENAPSITEELIILKTGNITLDWDEDTLV